MSLNYLGGILKDTPASSLSHRTGVKESSGGKFHKI